MTDNEHNEGGRADARDMRPSRRTELVRAAADNELTAADERALREHLVAHPDDDAVIAFEQGLRRAIASGASGVPSEQLREKVTRLTTIGGGPGDRVPSSAGSVTASGRGSRVTRWVAVAASVGLLTAMAYFTLRPTPSLPPPGRLIAESHRASLVSFVNGRHKECELHAEMVASGFRIDSLDKAPAAFSEILGKAPDLGRLAQSGLKFKGAEACAVPGRGRSVHMVLEAVTNPPVQAGGASAATATLVSIFVQQDKGELRIEPGRAYRFVPKAGPSSTEASEIYVWKKDGFVYFLASTSEPAIETVRLALDVQGPSGRL